MARFSKFSVTFTVILFFSISSLICIMPKSTRAEDTVLRNVFVDTLFGLGTGTVLAAALTLADSDAHGDDWARNLGVGAAIGGFIGATYGMAVETRHLVSLDGNRLSLHVPLPRLHTSKHSRQNPSLFLDLFKWKF